MDVYDVFISHASEDKDGIARPLAESLKDFGVNVWYDEFSLKIGDSLSRSIDKGLSHSNFGLVVLSPSFFEKNWTEYELRGLTAKEMGGSKVIITIGHKVSFEDVLKFSPTLSDKVAISTAKKSVDEIAIEIIEIIRPDIFTSIHKRLAYIKLIRSAKIKKVSLKEVKISPPRHKELPSNLISRIRLIRASLLGVYPHSMNYWIDGFRSDLYPIDEIEWWELIASAYLEYIQCANLPDKNQYYAVFGVILNIVTNGEKDNVKEVLEVLPADAYDNIAVILISEKPPSDLKDDFPFGKEIII